MTPLQRIQSALDHIETHLHEALDARALAALACMSPYHFQRVFHALSGHTVQDYLRRRRLSEAARRLEATDEPIVSIALEHGYGSQAAFTRAFEAQFGRTPARYRAAPVPTALQAPVRVDGLALTSPSSWREPTLVQRRELQVVGRSYRTALQEGRCFAEIPGFYQHFGETESYLQIPRRAAPAMVHGVSHGFDDEGGFSFLVGELVHPGAGTRGLPPDYTAVTLPAGRYAELLADGPAAAVPGIWQHAYGVWLPRSGLERAEGPDFEVTDVCASHYPEAMVTRIYIPVR